MINFKQLFCTHWFDIKPTYDYEYSSGQIVCTEQRTFKATVEPRECSKCGLQETRILNTEYLGWK